MEMMMKSQLGDFKKLKDGPVTAGTAKGFEMEFSGTGDGAAVHVLQRMFVNGTQLLTVLGTTDGATWEKQGEAIRKSIESLTFSAKSEPKEKKE
jgi:hypothetical protein